MLNQVFKILIVEDELLIAEFLKEMLLEIGIETVFTSKNYSEAIQTLEQQNEINLVMLDINLNEEKNGLDVARYITENKTIPFMFLTSYSDFKTIEEASYLQPHAYLTKPYTQSELFITLSLLKNKETKKEKFVQFKDGTSTIRLKQSEILWIKSENIYLNIKTLSKKYLIRSSITRFIEENENDIFFRSHRSFIVNLEHVKEVKSQFLVIENEKIPISRNFKDELIERMKNY